MTDIVFDYFLIKHWQKFTQIDFDHFIEESYAGLIASRQWMPERMETMVTKMAHSDWLRKYANLEGISIAIDQVSQRIRFENSMAGGITEIEQNYDEIEVVFLSLFAHLKSEVKSAAIEL